MKRIHDAKASGEKRSATQSDTTPAHFLSARKDSPLSSEKLSPTLLENVAVPEGGSTATNVVCFICKGYGHYANTCDKRDEIRENKRRKKAAKKTATPNKMEALAECLKSLDTTLYGDLGTEIGASAATETEPPVQLPGPLAETKILKNMSITELPLTMSEINEAVLAWFHD